MITKVKTYYVALTILVLVISSCKNAEDHNRNTNYQDYFIAHAGGAIDGINYTNCVEAMDLSYNKGCKLFELDLVLTTDGKIVAKHDPPGITEAEFMSQLIEGKYTPMNMDAINRWFENHSDAILVTDKLNDPTKIYHEFRFPDRLIMELFTWDAVDMAIELGIKPLVSENLIFGTSTIEKILEGKKIEYIGMSRYSMVENETFLRRLKEKGIKNYVWHLEWEIDGIPAEQYVWNYEMNFCYGMYANDLNILDSLKRIF